MACISWGLNDLINFAEVRGTNISTNIQSENGASSHSPEDSPEEPKDFDDSANALWSLYRKGIQAHDEARMQTLREDMDGLLIFVCIGYQPITSQSS